MDTENNVKGTENNAQSNTSTKNICPVRNHTQLDLNRMQRTGCPEVVFCEGKTPEQTADIFKVMVQQHGACFGTRASNAHYEAVKHLLPSACFHPDARTLVVENADKQRMGCVLVINAGTSDFPIAEEAAQTAEFLGSNVIRHFDCGVAGVQRALHAADDFSRASAIIAVAGMDGALPTLVAGLSPVPVIAVPTSIGYGTGLGGVAALMTMLNGCAPGVSVVNIDNGFGAGFQAHMINKMAARK